MATATGEVKSIAFGSLLATVYKTQLKALFLARKTFVLGVIMLLPVVGAILFASMNDSGTGGMSIYKGMVEYVIITFLLPLVCLFYGGPSIVDEIEGRTIIYLFLRPVSKPAIFLGKYLAGVTVSLVLVLVPIIPLFFILMAGGEGAEGQYQLFAQTLMSVAVGVLSYSAVFAMLGAAFGKSLLAGILYWAVAEWGLSFIPVLEFGTLKYHVRNAGSLIDLGNFGFIDQMVLKQAIEVPLWASYGVLAVVCLGALTVGAVLFNQRQYGA